MKASVLDRRIIGAATEAGNMINHVLVVEDDPDLAIALECAFRHADAANFVIERAVSLASAIALLGSHEIDMILLDLNLPDSRGLETFSKIQRIAPDLPVIILSGLPDEELAVESVRAGAQDYFVKGSMSLPVLMRAVRYAVERKQLQRRLADYARQLRIRNETMEAELNMARDIQRAYLPLEDADFPRAASPESALLHVHSRYQPAAELGGDFFDILEVSETEVGIFICDVMGHGVGAGLVAGLVRGLIEEARPFAADAGEFLAELNRGMRSVLCHTEGPIFATAFYLLIDLRLEELRYVNAGHPVPFFRHGLTSEVGLLSSGPGIHGPALGLFDEAAYEVSRFGLSPKDLFILYTDGLCEAADPEGTVFGAERLLGALRDYGHHSTPKLFDLLLQDAKDFTGLEPFEDDVCLIGVQMLPRASEDENPRE
ncbi:MAG: phosphoserine phosphatase RsbU/P [Verrucomicrobiota bacterium]|jgi:serine phosphatase RsbU (regulator of sigma subunit)